MKNICFYFQVHQPFRIRSYSIFDIGNSDDYFDHKKNREILNKVARKCYLPTNKLMLDLIHEHGDKFKIAYSISGTAIDQFEEYNPEVLNSFKALAKTGQVEFLNETYYHSLSFLYDKEEFKYQVLKHKQKMTSLFAQVPTVFRNTELIYNNELASFIENLGYKGILAEGADHILGWRSPNYMYRAKCTNNLKLLCKNYKLSDDIAFRFSNKGWKSWPLTADKYANWIGPVQGETINLFMDYETFGEHQWEDTGIFDFLRHLPGALAKKGIHFHKPSEIIQAPAKDVLDYHLPVSWADMERDLSAWLSNEMQHSSIKRLYELKSSVLNSGDSELIEKWRKLTTSDHFYYMCVKYFNDGDVHKYFSPYDSPYDSFINFMNVLNDLMLRVRGVNDHSNLGQKSWVKVS